MTIEQLLAEAASVGPFFAVRHPVAEADSRLSDLYAGGPALAERLAATAEALGTQHRRVAGSILFQGLAARLWSPVLAVALTANVVLDLDPDETAIGPDGLSGLPTGTAHPAPIDGVYRSVVVRHLEPLAGVLDVPATVLWGNASSSLVGSCTVLAAARPDIDTAEPLEKLLSAGRLAGTGRSAGPGSWRRNSCCLFYRVPGGGLCGDCVLHDQPSRQTS